MKEEWRDIQGYNGAYQVSNAGNVRATNYNGNGKAQELRQSIANGAKRVCLCQNNKKQMFSVHRLVAAAFLPNPNNFPEVNHKDENRLNNDVANLEW